MKIIKRVSVVLLSILLLLIAAGFLLPSGKKVERTITIRQNSEVPFTLVNNLQQWETWSPWHGMDTAAEWTYSDPAQGTGASYSWKSNNSDVGYGTLKITNSLPFDSILTELLFEDMPPSQGGFTFTQIKENECSVTWFMQMEFGYNPFARLMGLIMDKWLGGDFEKGLEKLKQVSEATPPRETIGGFDAEWRNLPEITVMGIRYNLPPAKVKSDVFAKSFERLSGAMAAQNLEPDGMPMALYYKLSNAELDFEAAMPVKGNGTPTGDIVFHTLPATRALVVNYRGAYDAMTPMYQAVYDYVKAKGVVQNGPSREVYITDPFEVPDTAQWLTEIVIPIQP